MLILTDKDVRRLIDMPSVLKAVEKAFLYHGKGLVDMPPKVYIHLERYKGDFRAMPAYIKGMEVCGIKWVNVHPGNARAGLPTVMAVIILSDPHSGLPLCIMDGTLVTNLRTGAAGGVAAKYLARKDSSIVGLVGCGVQARSQLLALAKFFRIKAVRIWGMEKDCVKRFLKDTASLGLEMETKGDIKDCVKGADIVVTTTPSRRPIVRSGWIKEGAHINAIGADAKGKEELEPELLKRARIVVDDWRQAYHSGEINVPVSRGMISGKDIHATLGEIVAGKKNGRTNRKEITIFDSTGLAIQDMAVADLIYRKALAAHAGRRIDIIK